MQINRNAERFGGLENFPELRLVQIFAARVGVDDRALEVQRFHGSLQFLRGGGRILRRNGGKSRKAVGMLSNRLGKLIVERCGERDGGWRIENLNARRSERKNLLRNSGGVHVADAALAQVLNLRANLGEARPGIIEVEAHEAREAGIVMRAVFEKLLDIARTIPAGRRPLRSRFGDMEGWSSGIQGFSREENKPQGMMACFGDRDQSRSRHADLGVPLHRGGGIFRRRLRLASFPRLGPVKALRLERQRTHALAGNGENRVGESRNHRRQRRLAQPRG